MKTQLKDVLHLYIGCKMNIRYYHEGDFIKEGEREMIAGEWCEGEIVDGIALELINTNTCDIVLILNPIADITEEDRFGIFNLIFGRDFPSGASQIFWSNRDSFAAPRWVLTQGLQRLGIETDGSVWAVSDINNYKHNQHEVTRYLLSKGYDLYNLIDSGQAQKKE